MIVQKARSKKSINLKRKRHFLHLDLASYENYYEQGIPEVIIQPSPYTMSYAKAVCDSRTTSACSMSSSLSSSFPSKSNDHQQYYQYLEEHIELDIVQVRHMMMQFKQKACCMSHSVMNV